MTTPEPTPTTPLPMPSHDAVYAFLKQHYRHDRFEGRNESWCPDYSHVVTRSTLRMLEEQGYSLISRHEAARGEPLWFGRDFQELDEAGRQAALHGELRGEPQDAGHPDNDDEQLGTASGMLDDYLGL